MDLYAYAQMEQLDDLVKRNGIKVPRPRGYRLMKDEDFITEEEIKSCIEASHAYVCRELCEARPFWTPNAGIYVTGKRVDYYISKDKDGNMSIRWDRIHGWKRKVLKLEIKKQAKRIREQFNMWNKYVGKDVLYIHARVGGNNWHYYGCDKLRKEPWFLDKVDDNFDSTYCDIYAAIEG